jgi:RNA polymerase sigma-70 factor (ECF subfamily)
MAGSLFPTTRRSIVAALASSDESERARAYDTLSSIYWKPLYKYARYARGHSEPDAEDLTQSFLADAFERNSLGSYDATKASFRTFLRTLFDRRDANEHRAATRIKRGGTLTVVDFAAAEQELARDNTSVETPEAYFQREWTKSVFAVAIDRLRTTLDDGSFALIEAYDLSDNREVSYRSLAERFSLPETTVTNRLAAARRTLRQIVLDLLREVTATDEEFRSEARSLLGVEP